MSFFLLSICCIKLKISQVTNSRLDIILHMSLSHFYLRKWNLILTQLKKQLDLVGKV